MQLKVLTIVTEALLEHILVKEIEKHGAHGYTITEARGKGTHGVRNAGWDNNANVRIEIVCTEEVCQSITKHLQDKYYDDYAMISFFYDATVQRNNKF
jgi:nitrogen regulatory protein PII